MRVLFAALALAAGSQLLACSAVERGAAAPSEAGSAVTIDSVARLGRLLLLAPVATCSDCDGSWASEPADLKVDAAAVKAFLTDWKDYEVTIVPRDEGTDALVRDLAGWHERLEANEPMPAPLQARLEALVQAQAGPAAGVSPGVLVIHSHVRYLSATDLALYFMIVGMPNLFKKTSERNASIALYDPTRGALLWERFFNVGVAPYLSLHQQIMREMEYLPAAAR